jgi:hypothetical protein
MASSFLVIELLIVEVLQAVIDFRVFLKFQIPDILDPIFPTGFAETETSTSESRQPTP